MGKKFPFATTWMDLEGIMLSKINQMEKDKYPMNFKCVNVCIKKERKK